jgi:hypothetical protein
MIKAFLLRMGLGCYNAALVPTVIVMMIANNIFSPGRWTHLPWKKEKARR